MADIRVAMNGAMESGCGIYREEKTMRTTCDTLGELKGRYKKVKLQDTGRAFNTELMYAVELGNMLDIAEALAHSAINRKESRGSHQRLDHKERDDSNYLKHSLAYLTPDGSPRLDYKSVVITRWPPGKRTYGAESGLKKDTGGKAS